MRVLVVSNYGLPHIGGVEVLVDREVRLLAEAGHDVWLIVADCGQGPVSVFPENVRVERIGAWNILEHRFGIPWPLFSPKLLTRLWSAVFWCDVVHCHGYLGLNTLLAFLIARCLRKSMVLTEHAGRSWYRQGWKRALQDGAIHTLGRLNTRLAHQAYACHGRVFRQLMHLAGRDERVELLLFPADRSHFRPPTATERAAARAKRNWSPNRPKILFVGRLTTRKGIDLLLAAQDEQYDLVFCGPGNPKILGDVDGRRVEWLGALTHEELLEVYWAADLLALPSRSEGNLVLVAQEALLCGIPVLLGEDPDLRPYRDCPKLFFSPLQPDAIRANVLRILAACDCSDLDPAEPDPLASYVPTPQAWIERLLSVSARRRLSSHLAVSEEQ